MHDWRQGDVEWVQWLVFWIWKRSCEAVMVDWMWIREGGSGWRRAAVGEEGAEELRWIRKKWKRVLRGSDLGYWVLD